jgi:NAD(P) transhydrogenase subunit alpha
MEPVYLTFVFILAIFLGFELISKVPSTLHTPLMSGSNAISGITLVGAIASLQTDSYMLTQYLSTAPELVASLEEQTGNLSVFLGTLAVIFATVNVVGGYMVTNRMLEMFKKKEKSEGGSK